MCRITGHGGDLAGVGAHCSNLRGERSCRFAPAPVTRDAVARRLPRLGALP
jgi:hypothetical protein